MRDKYTSFDDTTGHPLDVPDWAANLKFFPLKPETKEPHRQLAPKGFKDASADWATLADWDSVEDGINWGLPTGQQLADGGYLVVLDVDPRHGGDQSLAAIMPAIGANTTRVLTARRDGGHHLYFASPVPLKTTDIAPGLDLRADGAYVVIPPSFVVIPDSKDPDAPPVAANSYEWANTVAPTPWPDWLPTTRQAHRDERQEAAGSDDGPIPEGQRNTTLTSIAGRLRRIGLEESEIFSALSLVNQRRCQPPLDDTEVQRIARSIAQYEPGSDDGTREGNQATRLVGYVRDIGVELWHDDQHHAWATIPVDEHRENVQLSKKTFKRFLSRLFFGRENTAIGGNALSDALGVLEANALFNGKRYEVHLRVAKHGDAIFYDIGDTDWRVVHVTADGWEVISDPPVKFKRTGNLLALPEPERGGDLAEFAAFLPVDDTEFRLMASWCIQAMLPEGPYPVAVLGGEQGSGKSNLSRMLKAAIDPTVAPLRSDPKEVGDLMVGARNDRLLVFDNLSHLSVQISDGLCRLATGGALMKRELYTDAEETVLAAQRPVLLNGIGSVAIQPDLLDRALVFQVAPLDDSRRLPESELWEAFDAAKPRIFGALLDVLVTVLRDRPSVRLERYPRMADFAKTAAAAAPILGWTAEDFLARYTDARAEVATLPLENSLVAPVLWRLANKSGGFKGTSTDLLKALNNIAQYSERDNRYWPKTPRVLSDHLRKIAPALRHAGLEVEFYDRARPKEIVVRVKAGNPATPATGAANDCPANDFQAASCDGPATATDDPATEPQSPSQDREDPSQDDAACDGENPSAGAGPSQASQASQDTAERTYTPNGNGQRSIADKLDDWVNATMDLDRKAGD